MWKMLECKGQCSSPSMRHGYSMISYHSGHKVKSHPHPARTKQILKPEQQNVLEWRVNIVKEIGYRVLTLYKQVWKCTDTCALSKHFWTAGLHQSCICCKTTSETIFTRFLPILTSKQLLFKADLETPSTTLGLSCGKAVWAQAVLEVINWAPHSHSSFIFTKNKIGAVRSPVKGTEHCDPLQQSNLGYKWV